MIHLPENYTPSAARIIIIPCWSLGMQTEPTNIPEADFLVNTYLKNTMGNNLLS